MFKKIIKIICLLVAGIMLTGCNKAESFENVMRVGSLKGPTSMGLLFLMDQSKKGQAEGKYEFQMAVQADELLALMAKGELDVALIPANVAGILYQKMDKQLEVININTLGVLYMVTGEKDVTSITDLKGKTIYLTGKGTTPDYVLRYLLQANGLSEKDCKLEYKSEATEVAALLSQNPQAVGLLPQPFVTAATAQNEALFVALDMNEEWNKVQKDGSGSMVTGVTVVRKEFLDQWEDQVKLFLQEHEKSVDSILQDPDTGAALSVEAGIIAKEPIAKKAIPQCNITYIDGEAMKQALSGYLAVLYGQNPQAVGGQLPGEDFYYVP